MTMFKTRSSAIAEGPRDAPCQLKLRNVTQSAPGPAAWGSLNTPQSHLIAIGGGFLPTSKWKGTGTERGGGKGGAKGTGLPPLMKLLNATVYYYNENLYSPKIHGRYRQDTDMYKRQKENNNTQYTLQHDSGYILNY